MPVSGKFYVRTKWMTPHSITSFFPKFSGQTIFRKTATFLKGKLMLVNSNLSGVSEVMNRP